MSYIERMYKLVRYRNGNYYTLFHGVDGSKILPLNTWISAEIRSGRDGGGSKWYTTGFHCLSSIEDCRKYLKNFRDKEEKYIVECICDGIWEKPTKGPVQSYLCKRIFLIG